tara:strand:+ start:8449 stop:9426 length:978 start_codon:yes stop_codon:yes gene_type:complete
MFWLVAIMIVVGGLTRLTDSGLSITEWELFSGILPPLNKTQWIDYFELYKKIPEYQLQNFSMTLSEFKIIFWWEWAHRILGRIIGLAYLLPLVYFVIKLGVRESFSLILIFFLICFQGFIGWYMVSSGLVERVDVSHFRLAMHLIIAFIILSLIYWNYLKFKNTEGTNKNFGYFIPSIFVFLIFIQIIIGAFVSGMDAGTVYNSWPLMGETYFPNDSKYSDLLGPDVFNDPSLVQFFHRNLAYIILFFFFYILFYSYKKKLTSLYYSIKVLGSVLFLQIVLGILTILFGAQIFLASMHQITSIFLVTSSIYFLFINTKTNSQPSV